MVCLESKDFVQIRNSLIVLTKIIQFFPVIQNLATVIEKRIDKVGGDLIRRREKYPDYCFSLIRFARMRKTKDKIFTSKLVATRDN